MKLALAIAVAKQQTSPDYLGRKLPDHGIYLANNGQYMTGPVESLPYRLAKRQWTWADFLAQVR